MERKILVFSFVVSIILHIFFAYLLFSLKTLKEKKEKKPIVVSFVKPKKITKDKNFSAKRKIPKKTKLTTSSKTVLPKKKQVEEKKIEKASKKIVPKKKVEKKQPVKKEKKHRNVPALKKLNEKITQEKNVNESKEVKKEKSLKTKKTPIKQKKIEKTLQIAKSAKKEEKENKKPKVNAPLSKKINPEREKKEPVKQINLTHLKGKDQIFQMQSEDKPKKEEIIVEAKGKIKKYLFYVRDKLQENLSYPLMAKRLQIEGTVIVRFVIEEDGSVDENSIKIVKSSGSKILDMQSIITVKNSIPFKPPPEGKIVIEIPVVFEIIRSYY